MVSFTILLFFALTGITLNHQASFSNDVKPKRFTGTLDTAWMKAPDAKKDAIVAEFRSRHECCTCSGARAEIADREVL